MRTGEELRSLILNYERELAYGSRTIIYNDVVKEFGASMSNLNDDDDVTKEYYRYKEAYEILAEWIEKGLEGNPFTYMSFIRESV